MSGSSVFELTAKQVEALAVLKSGAEHIMLFGGSRSGKTFLLTLALITRAVLAPKSRHAIWRLRLSHLRASIWSDTMPKVMQLCYPALAPKVHYNKQDLIATLPNGSEVWFGGLDDKDRVEKVLGQEFATIYYNECSQIPFGSVTTSLTRLAQVATYGSPAVAKAAGSEFLSPRAFYDCNPPGRKHWTHKQWIEKLSPETGRALGDPQLYASLQMNPVDNRRNLPPGYIERTLANLPPRKRSRFLLGEFSDDREGALWNYGIIRRADPPLPDMRRVVVAIDPAASNEAGSDETGLIVAGVGADGRGYVLEDATLKGSPEEWASAAVKLYRKWDADLIIGEVNNGGDMVEATVHAVDRNVPFKKVRASRGKVIRAEPVAALYELGRVLHVADFDDLEEQMCDFTLDFDRDTAGYSPDRLDALVWALTELMVGEMKGQGLFELARRQAEEAREAAKAASPALARVEPDKPSPAPGSVEWMKLQAAMA